MPDGRISFGAEHWARAWLQETGSPFPLLLDPERATYRTYGLGSSFIRVWRDASWCQAGAGV